MDIETTFPSNVIGFLFDTNLIVSGRKCLTMSLWPRSIQEIIEQTWLKHNASINQ